MSQQTIEMMGRQIKVDISARADREMSSRETPLHVEMELYFSCLLRKQIRVYEAIKQDQREKVDGEFSVQLADKLRISFRPVMTKSCSVASCEGEKPPLSDFPIQKPQAYVPKWLTLDFRKGEWCGDFGY